MGLVRNVVTAGMCATLAAACGGGGSQPHVAVAAATTSAATTSAAMTPTTSGTAPAGSVENPFVDKNCLSHKPGDLDGYGIAVGPAHIPTMPNLADWYGGGLPSPNSDDVTFYKGGTEIGPTHPAVTVTIAPDARSYARLVTMYAPEPDTVSVVYVGTPKPPAGSDWACGYVGGYDLLGGRTTACVPLDIKIEGDPVVHHVVVSIGRKCPTS